MGKEHIEMLCFLSGERFGNILVVEDRQHSQFQVRIGNICKLLKSELEANLLVLFQKWFMEIKKR